MFRRSFCAVFLLVFLAPRLAADEGALAPRAGVLVLRNGQIVQGRITRWGDRYVVTIGEASEVRFPVGDVEFQCANLEEAYFRKRDLVDPTSTRQRLELAEWCLRHELPHRAADQLLAAMKINPFDARARSLRRRLLQLADARQIAAQAPPEKDSAVDWEAIDHVMETTPVRAVEEFTSTVQSLLLNRCGTNACHGHPANSNFHLMRPLRDKALPRRLTQRNLYATLQMIDFDDPNRSPILTVPRGPHGGADQGLFAGRQERQWEQLRDWVLLAVQPAEVTDRDSGTGRFSRPAPPTSAEMGMQSATVLRPATAEAPHDEIHRSVFAPGDGPSPPGAVYVPRDPFDPEVFNCRYFPETTTPSASQTPVEATSRN